MLGRARENPGIAGECLWLLATGRTTDDNTAPSKVGAILLADAISDIREIRNALPKPT